MSHHVLYFWLEPLSKLGRFEFTQEKRTAALYKAFLLVTTVTDTL